MNRRTYLLSGGATVATLAGFAAVGTLQDESQVEYQGKDIVYERDDLSLRLRQEPISLGDTGEFEVTNTGDSKITLGCNNPWAIQKQSDGDWQHVTWTGDRYYQMCATELSPGDSLVEGITLSKSGLERGSNEHSPELRPGQYRFLLLGSSPYLALEFELLDSE